MHNLSKTSSNISEQFAQFIQYNEIQTDEFQNIFSIDNFIDDYYCMHTFEWRINIFEKDTPNNC